MTNKTNGIGKRVVESYANFIAHQALLVLVLCVILLLIGFHYASMLETTGLTQQDMLPEDIEVVNTFNLISDQFAGSLSSVTIVVEIDPQYANSDEIRDVRDPEVLRYVDLLSQRATLVYGIRDSESAADVIKSANGGEIPSSLRSVKSLLAGNELIEQQISHYISDDYTLSVVRLGILADADENKIVEGLREAINIDKPPGVSVNLAGTPVIMIAMQELATETMGSTSTLSLAAIIIILIIVFASIKYGLIPLVTIVFGLVWAFGAVVIGGFEITPQTSGVMAMIMGIGIDFGIQVTKRFRYELRLHKREDAMVNTLTNVLYPMLITTIAAIVGFLALHLGQLPMMADMGTMMATGVLFCMIAALTVVPALLVISERKRPKVLKEDG